MEGIHDIHFLCRISRMLHAEDPALPDLAVWEAAGRLVFLPFGGGDVWEWTHRLAPLGLNELHPNLSTRQARERSPPRLG